MIDRTTPRTINNGSEGIPRRLLSKRELAAVLGVSTRTIENWLAQKRIPQLRLSERLTRFSLPRVEAALARYEFFVFNADGTLAGWRIEMRDVVVDVSGSSYTATGTSQLYDINGNPVGPPVCATETATRLPM
jgi:excisionase family DNA binding protein